MPKTYFKAPPYFVEAMSRCEQWQDKAASLLGVDINWVKQSTPEGFKERLEMLKPAEADWFARYSNRARICSEFAWAKLMYENIDTEHEMEFLTWDRDKQIIKIGQSPEKKFLKGLKDLVVRSISHGNNGRR